MNERLKKILRIIIILILILINIFILIKNLLNEEVKKSESSNNVGTNVVGQENILSSGIISNETTIIENRMSSMSEGNRAQTYFGEFIDEVENEEFSNAYNMLNDEYKKNYFPNQSDFEQYVKEKYPKGSIAVKYNSFDKKSDLFVLDVIIYSITDSNSNQLNQTVVIKENGLNDFKISFSKWYAKNN